MTLMIRKALTIIQLCSTLLLSCGVVAMAQGQAAATKEDTTVSPEKRALVKELLDLTNSRQSSAALFKAQFDEMEKQLPEIEWQAITAIQDFGKLTPAQRNQMRAKLGESTLRMSTRIKTLFEERIDMQQLIEDITVSVYDKHFSADELRDLVTFYKSPTGKKVMEVTPLMLSESAAKASELVAPKVTAIVEEIQKEETKQFTHDIQELLKATPKPAPKPAGRRP
jgi:uncharacterized protein